MRGTIYLAGGGTAEDELPLWTEMLRDGMNVSYWPFALSGSVLDGADAWLRSILRENWPGVRLTTWRQLDGHHPGELGDFDLLFVGGGNTFDLLYHVAAHGFLDPVREFVAAGGSFYGGSAGAILASEDIGIAEIYNENLTDLADLSGLGLVRDVLILPHYSTGEDLTARTWCRRRGLPVLGIPERSGVVVKHDGGARVVGASPVSLVTSDATRLIRPGELLRLVS